MQSYYLEVRSHCHQKGTPIWKRTAKDAFSALTWKELISEHVAHAKTTCGGMIQGKNLTQEPHERDLLSIVTCNNRTNWRCLRPQNYKRSIRWILPLIFSLNHCWRRRHGVSLQNSTVWGCPRPLPWWANSSVIFCATEQKLNNDELFSNSVCLVNPNTCLSRGICAQSLPPRKSSGF